MSHDTEQQPIATPPENGSSTSVVAENSTSQPPRSNGYQARPLMNEVRQKMAEMNEREYSLRRREFEVEQLHRNIQRSARDAAENQLQTLREKLTARQEALEQLEGEVERTRRILDERENAIDRRAHDMDLVERDLHRAREELTAAQQRLADQREALRQRREVERQNVVSRIETVRERHDELEKEAAALREAVASERRAIAKERDENEQNREEIVTGLADVQARREELARSESDLQSCLEAAEREQLEIDSQRTALSEAETAHAERVLVADERDEQFIAMEQDLATREAALQENLATLEQDKASLASQTAQLDQLEATLRQREQEQTALGHELQTRDEACTQREADLLRKENALANQQQSLSQLQANVERRDAELNQERDELFDLRTQVESREAEARQAAAALEIERTEVDGLRVRLEQSATELEGKRAQSDREIAQVQRAIARESRRLRNASESIVTAPSRWFARSLFLSTLAGTAAALGWFAFEQPKFRSAAHISVVSDTAEFSALAPRHIVGLSSPMLFDDAFTNAIDQRQWERLWQNGQVRIAADPATETIRVAVTDSDPVIADQFATELRNTYVDLYQPVTLTDSQSAALANSGSTIAARRQWLTNEIARVEAQREAIAESTTRDIAAELAQARTDVQQLREEQESTLDRVRSTRSRLTALLSDEFPRGVVSESELQAALDADEMYLEDQREYDAVIAQHRRELGTALATPTESIDTFDQKLRDFQRIMREQVELKPPELVAKALEDSLAEIEETSTQLDAFRSEWREFNTRLGRVNGPREAAQALDIFDEADKAAVKMKQNAENLVRGIRARLDELRAIGGGSTREVVVMAVVHGEFNNLFSALADFVTALQSVDLAQNFKLDALDRQMRTIKTRLETRPETLKRQMQITADEDAQEAHAREIAQVRAEVQNLESKREELAARVFDALELLRTLTEESDGTQQIRAKNETLTLLADQYRDELIKLKELPALPRSRSEVAIPQDRLVKGGVEQVQLAGADRLRNAGIAGGATALASLLMCLMMVIRMPFTRNPNEAALATFLNEQDDSAAPTDAQNEFADTDSFMNESPDTQA